MLVYYNLSVTYIIMVVLDFGFQNMVLMKSFYKLEL